MSTRMGMPPAGEVETGVAEAGLGEPGPPASPRAAGAAAEDAGVVVGCVFCDVVAGRRPGTTVVEGEGCVAIMDLHPVRPGHVLVIPRAHAPQLHQLPEAVQEEVFRLGRRVDAAHRAAGLSQAATYLLLDGPASGQHFGHVHLHVIPRLRGDLFRVVLRFVGRMLLASFGRAADRPRLDATAARIRSHLR